jgi:hypothetical protein
MYEGLQAAPEHADGFLGHGRQIRQRPHERLAAVQEDDLADALGIVADPLQVADNAQRRDDLAQVRGHRLLRGNQIDAPVLQLPAFLVHLGVVGNDLFGRFGIQLLERLDRAADGVTDHLAHLQNVVFQLLDPSMKALSWHFRFPIQDSQRRFTIGIRTPNPKL